MHTNVNEKKDESISAVWILSLALFAGFTVAGLFWYDRTLYWDTGRLFTQFRDHLQAINRFGEIAWWLPQNQMGYPAYFASVLNTASNFTPTMMLWSFALGLLGRLGVMITHYQPLYVFQFGFILPALFLFGLERFSRGLIRSQFARRGLLIMAAFSPGVVFSISDIGFLEPLAFSLFLFAGYWQLLQNPNRINYRRFLWALFLLTLTLNNASLYWNVFAVPITIIYLSVTPWPQALKRFSALLRFLGPKRITTAFFLILIGLGPQLIALQEGGGIVQPALGERTSYDYTQLAAGNPLEVLSASLPGFGFDWNASRTQFQLKPFSVEAHAAYYYLGLLCLPLVGLALIFGRRRERWALFFFFVLAFAIMPLSAYSPFFSALLIWETPLRSCNHYSDVSFKAGGFLLLIWAAAAGLEVWQNRRKFSKTVALFFSFGALGTFLFYLVWFGRSVMENRFFGFLLLVSVLYLIPLIWLSRNPSQRERKQAQTAFLAILLLDLSTNAFAYVRTLENSTYHLDSGWRAYATIDERDSANGLGMELSNHPHYYNNRLLMFQTLAQMLRSGWQVNQLPAYQLYSSAHAARSLSEEWNRFKNRDSEKSLPIDPLFLSNGQLDAFLRAKNRSIPNGVRLTRQSPNQLEIDTESDQPALLFIRDGFSPYWRAWVNGVPCDIYRAFYNFKAVVVPSGTAHLTLAFDPPGLAWAVYLSFITMVGLSIVNLSELEAFKVPLQFKSKSARQGA